MSIFISSVLTKATNYHLGSPSHMPEKVLRPAAHIYAWSLHNKAMQCWWLQSFCRQAKELPERLNMCGTPNRPSIYYVSAGFKVHSHCVNQLRISGCSCTEDRREIGLQTTGAGGAVHGPCACHTGQHRDLVLSTLLNRLQTYELGSSRNPEGSFGC